MSDDVLVKANCVSKKFCRSLKRSLWYGMQDVGNELIGRSGGHNKLRKNEFWAVKNVSFELKRGECLGLIGPNGAGKSTLLKMLNGLIKPDHGRITMRGRVGALIELGAGFNPILTARENIFVNGSVLGFSKREIHKKFDAIVDFAELEEFIDTPVQNFSSGMKVRLGFAVASQLDPDVLLIDEVLAVGDARFVFKCINRISAISRNCAVIIVSHSMPMVSRMCSSAVSLDNGMVAYSGTEVGLAVEAYLSKVDLQSDNAEQSEYFEIESVSFCGGPQSRSNHETHKLSFMQPFDLELVFRLKKTAPPCHVNLAFMDMEGKPVAQCWSRSAGLRSITAKKSLRVRTTIDSLALNPGRYFIHLALVEALSGNRLGEILYQNRFLTSFSVIDGFMSWAPVQLSGKWECIAE